MKNLLRPIFYCICCLLYCKTQAGVASYFIIDSYHSTSFDQVPADTSYKKAAGKDKKSIGKILTNIIKFKKNAREKERDRMVKFVETLGIKDSISLTSSNLKWMIRELDKKENRHFDSLHKIFNSVNNNDQRPPPSEAHFVSKPSTDNLLSENDLKTLANQILPLLNEEEAEEKKDNEKKESIRKIKEVKANNPGMIYYEKNANSVVKRYNVSVKNKAEVFGFYDGTIVPAMDPPNLSYMNSLIYHSLLLNGATGDFVNMNGWADSPVITNAQKAGCKVYFSVLLQNKDLTASFLYNGEAQQRCISNLLVLLKKRNANGLLISFKNLNSKDRNPFTEFMRLVFNALVQEDSTYQLFLTIPRFDKNAAYDIQVLNDYAHKFFIDFATNTSSSCGPLAPLWGRKFNSIEHSFSTYESQGIKAGKMIMILPYRGTRWQTDSGLIKNTIFSGYLSVGAIQKRFGHSVLYDEETTSVYIDTLYPDHKFYKIWFDNEISLGEKYDYILDNHLGGVGIYCINYEDEFPELRDELIYKFSYIDSAYLPDSIIIPPTAMSFFKRLQGYLTLYGFILQNPCANCFESPASSPGQKRLMLSLITDLKIDSLVKAEKKEFNFRPGQERPSNFLQDEFNYINRHFNKALFYTTLFFFVLSGAFFLIYLRGMMYRGESWTWKKVIASLLILSNALFVLFAFTFCFTDDLISVFGVSHSSSSVVDCSIDLSCVNIPFSTLLLIITVSILLGLLLFRYLITSLLKRRDVP